MNQKANAITTSGFIGIAAYICTDIVHEVIGHGGAALLAGIDISLLSSVYFKTNPGNYLVSLSGPLANLIFGIVLLTILSFKPSKTNLALLFLTTLMAYNLFWFSGTIVQSALSKTGDWTHAIARLTSDDWVKPLLLIFGILSYWLSIKLSSNRIANLNFGFLQISLRQIMLYAFLFAAVSAYVAGLFYTPDRLGASKEGLMEMVASLPILFLTKMKQKETIQATAKTPWVFYISVFTGYILFCFLLGKGIY
ncbi:MAG: hypothetical protein KDC79_12895 [Cyclobacteriaceae bacterium]|nr:hypothetical protein [Cyclobacteriaceae bacterium]